MPARVSDNMQPAATSFSLRNPPYSYLHLKVVNSQPSGRQSNMSMEVDDITIRSYCNSAMQQQFGLTGAAVPLEVLKVQGPEAWMRVPKEDEAALLSALSQWTGVGGTVTVRVLNRSSWLGQLDRDSSWDTKLWTLES